MIELSHIDRHFQVGDQLVKALDDVTLHIGAGEYVSIMGPSGSGKSTLLNLIGLLDRPGQGSIEVEGIPITRYRDKQVAKLRNATFGFIFQSFHLIPDLREMGGYVQDKVEGLAIFEDGTAWVSTDNDGVDDSSGETFFWSIGQL